MEAHKLSDEQLYNLVIDSSLPQNLKQELQVEFSNRNFTDEQINKLDISIRNQKTEKDENDLSLAAKALIIAFPFILVIHSIISARYVLNKRKHKSYWNCICIGFMLWAVILIIVTRTLDI
tara:strand:+ start:127 stop:489 length:363 start_codon:yes stop_codon:yes gene_type:complete